MSFNIACGTCRFCKKKYSSMCEYTNNSSMQEQMYGQRDAGFFGYGHLSELGCLSSGSDLVWTGLVHSTSNPPRTSSEGCAPVSDEMTEDAVQIIADRAQPEDSPAVRQSTPACPLARSTASRSQRVFQVSANASSIHVRSS